MVLQKEPRRGLRAMLSPSFADQLMAIAPEVSFYLPAVALSN